MDCSCFKCHFRTSNISEIITHLQKKHLLYEGSKLNLQCCFGCPSTFKTYSGFRKHFRKCQLKTKDAPSVVCVTEKSSELEPRTNNSESIIEHAIENFNESVVDENLNNTCQANKNDIDDQITNYTLKMYSLGLPDTTIDTILHCTSELVFPIFENVLENDIETKCKNMIEGFMVSFENRMTRYRRRKTFQELHIVNPVQKSHGIRIDRVYDSAIQRYKQVPVTCTFSYVPILETLDFIFRNAVFREHFLKKSVNNPESYKHFVDGDLYKESRFFIDNPNAIQIQMYYDEFEVCNPLGSKTGNHKIGAFYFVINNFAMQLNSYLENIHLLALCYNADVKQFGINPVLDVIVKELKILEDKGIFIEDLDMTIKGTLVSLSHDNLGGAVLLGMVESFQANNFCRICLMNKHDSQVICTQIDSLLRTTELFEEHAELVAADDSVNNVFGIKHRSPLNDLSHFKLGQNCSVDVGHDFLEGICQLEIKRFVTFLVEDKLCCLDDVNQRVLSFDYGLENNSNKPSPINISKPGGLIGQRAAQTHCLIIFLPLILKDIVEKLERQHILKWEVILLLIKIVKIVFAPQITHDTVKKLELLIKTHHEKYIQAYCAQLTPKHHMITHYPMIIEKMGPPKSYWTLRFESQHGYFKDLVHKLKNFKNICHTLAHRHQQNVLYTWENLQSFEPIPKISHFKHTLLEKNVYYSVITEALNIAPHTYIDFGKRVDFNGARLMLNTFVCTNFSNNLPIFSKALSFFYINFTVYAVCQPYDTLEISDEFLGYSIRENDDELFIKKITELAYPKSFRSYKTSSTDCEFIITEFFL